MRHCLFLPSFLIAINLSFIGCAASGPRTKDYVPPHRVEHNLGSWDHDKIRQVRETEQAMAINEIPEPVNNTKNCVVMTDLEMQRAKVTGCTPIDPRAGHGDNAYCCPEASE